MKISVITWDASFREKFHTVDAFCKQNYPKDQFEFIWCDFHKVKNPVLIDKIAKYSNAKIVNLNNTSNSKWHLGKTINEGLKIAKGEIIVIPDGDIIVDSQFLQNIENKFTKTENDLVIYFRRWDEPKDKSGDSSFDIEYLKKNTHLYNPTNFGGCFAVNKSVFEEIGYYEEHEIFSGPGANGLEQFIRFRNKGLSIMWDPKKIYHPYHSFTGTSDKISDKLKDAEKSVPWLNSYNGLEQSWVIKSREISLDWKANDASINNYLKKMPSIEELVPTNQNKSSILKKLIKKINIK